MDNNADANEISIESKHKKEKKELQAKIQALKKAARNDKSKKKEALAEIARLELEMEMRHKQELEESEELSLTDKEVVPQLDNSEKTENIGKLKISKAQKRRDKKIQQEKEREEQIKLQEKENINGPRNTEIIAISTRLKERGLCISSVPSDGDCLYKAISHQLHLKKKSQISVEDLRKNVSTYIRNNKDDFLPFLSHPDTYEMLTDAEFDEYCDKICNTKVWGGQVEIRALSNILKCPITVIQATGPEAIEQGVEFSGPTLIITYHRHMYSLGEHYNSTEEICENAITQE